jgi:DNA helicase-2/ATP-dependent DNA helicase PcrA
MTTEGPVLVLAGPGSGKTRVLTHRVAYLVQERGVPPWRIVAVTFTNKAAKEMRSRLEVLLGNADLRDLTIGTFHAICVRILRREADTLGLNRSFVIYDDSDQQNVTRRAIRDLNIDEKLYRPRSMHGIISRAKTNLLPPEAFEPSTYREEVARRVYARYQDLLEENNALDFDDLLMRVVLGFREQPALLAKYQQRYHYVLVDEFQDTNTVQYELVRQLAGGRHNLFGVGDEDQSIYAFRGADFYNVVRFEEDYPNTFKILLERNYRSTQTILDVANAVIAPNTQRTPKKLFTERSKGTAAYRHEAYDENEEARWVVETIIELSERGVAPGDCAVMYRTNAQSRALEDAFVAQNMPYKLVGATRFYARREIKDLLAYLRIIHNPYDAVSLMRILNVPRRKIGATTQRALLSWAAELGLPVYDALDALVPREGGKAASTPLRAAGRRALIDFYQMWHRWIAARDQVPVLDLLDQVIQDTRYGAYVRDGTTEGEDRWENVLELRAVASEFASLPSEEALTTFLEEISLVSDVDNLDDTEAPTLLTLHSAKGLEFGTVFIVGLNDGLLPHSRSFEDPDGMEEERRLFYVGVTRAQNRLYLSHTFRRTTYGGPRGFGGNSDLGESSRFLADIPTRLTVDATRATRVPERGRASVQGRFSDRGRVPGRGSTHYWSPSGQPGRARRRDAAAMAPYRAGDKVAHASFGQGTVIQVEQRSGDWDVTVAFEGQGIKTLAASFAHLEKIS